MGWSAAGGVPDLPLDADKPLDKGVAGKGADPLEQPTLGQTPVVDRSWARARDVAVVRTMVVMWWAHRSTILACCCCCWKGTRYSTR